jgi:hypothetical protein
MKGRFECLVLWRKFGLSIGKACLFFLILSDIRVRVRKSKHDSEMPHEVLRNCEIAQEGSSELHSARAESTLFALARLF